MRGVARYEAKMWRTAALKAIPGWTGCAVRNRFMGYTAGTGTRVWDGEHIEFPELLTIGARVTINRGGLIHAGGEVHIGDDVLIGPRVTIYSQNHAYNDPFTPINAQGYKPARVVIEDGAWIGTGAIIMPGVTIGTRAVVAAGGIVTRDVEPWTLVAGSPARRVRDLHGHARTAPLYASSASPST